jgi:BirA family biotin operon repressor/biotin-[acetyl-CoA-carboxylase] ligase
MGAPRDGREQLFPFARTVFVHDVLDSTSSEAARLVRERSCRLPVLVWAREQTHGRGRGENSWWSDAGSLTFTIAFDPASLGLRLQSEPLVALATAVAVIDGLNDLGLGSPALGIRWPNDLEASGRKLGGILPERIDTAAGHRLLIGIGINVRTNLADAPASVRTMATSLSELRAAVITEDFAERLIPAILRQLERNINRLASSDSSIACEWGHLDTLHDTWVRIDAGTRIIAGWARGIDKDGALWVHDGQQAHRVVGGRVLRDA